MTRFKYKSGLSSRDINKLCESLVEKYNNTHYSLAKAARNVAIMLKHSEALRIHRDSSVSNMNFSIASVPRPDSIVITPFVTSNAVILGGGDYTLSSDSAEIDSTFGSISKDIVHSEERISDLIVTESEETIHQISSDDSFLNASPWIAECDGDINLTVYLNQFTTQYFNNLRIIPTAGCYVKQFKYSHAPEGATTWTTLFNDTSRNIYDLYLDDIRATAIRIRLSGTSAIKGLDRLSVRRTGMPTTDSFIMTFDQMPTVKSVEFYAYTVTSESVQLESVNASAEVLPSLIRVTIPESIAAIHQIIIRR